MSDVEALADLIAERDRLNRLLDEAVKRNDQMTDWYTAAQQKAVDTEAERDRLRADVRELVEFVRQFNGCAYPVAKEIDPRGHRWSEIWLDHALRVSTALLAKHNPLQALADNARELGLTYEDGSKT